MVNILNVSLAYMNIKKQLRGAIFMGWISLKSTFNAAQADRISVEGKHCIQQCSNSSNETSIIGVGSWISLL
jgi:hypothetical protein